MKKASLVLKKTGGPIEITGLLYPLKDNNGVVFPYTPTIMFSHAAGYGQYDVTGANYHQNYYTGTSNPTISVTAMFSSNTLDEAKYTTAAIQFFKASTKSQFGVRAGAAAGTPPPILMFNAYGQANAKNVPVVVRSFNYTLPEDTDYVTFDDPVSGELSVPALILIQIELTPQIPPKTVKDNFSLQDYASGNNLRGGGFL
jgi:hypothetical protein